MKKLKPQKLKSGDTVAVLSPSWGGPAVCTEVYENGLKTLEELGLKIKEYPSARKSPKYLYENPQFRAEDINNAFTDKEVNAIFTSIGGDDSIRILPFLELEIITSTPKIFMGYSDTTTLTTYLNQHGLITFNGPSIMAGFSQWDALGSSFQEHIKTILFSNREEYMYEPFGFYSNGYPDWGKKENLGKVKDKKNNKGWQWLQGDKCLRGELFGGCIEVFQFMNGTTFWPEIDFWNDKILFFETSEEKPSPEEVRWALRNLGMQGILDVISALIFGRARDYTIEEKNELNKNILKVVNTEFNRKDLLVVSNMDFGHTDPQWILPLGIQAEIDPQHKTFKLIESIFSD